MQIEQVQQETAIALGEREDIEQQMARASEEAIASFDQLSKRSEALRCTYGQQQLQAEQQT